MDENLNGIEQNSIHKKLSQLTILEAYKRLSRRESEVLAKIEEGKSSQEIADELFISKKTVENHVTNIGMKLELSGRGRLRKWLRKNPH